MAGMDWFRWHHGSVTDPKFQLVAKKAGASVAEVLAVWACLLEAASQAETRGNPGQQDFEALDCALGLSEGMSGAIYEQMLNRGLLTEEDGIAAWDKRQPKREREDATNADRQASFRARQNQVTPDNATVSQKTPREEKSREEKKEKKSAIAPPDGVSPQTWSDWLQLRKSKRAPVTDTVIDGARREAGLAGMTLEAFLRVWCTRGSQGLEAAWLNNGKPAPSATVPSSQERDPALVKLDIDARRAAPIPANIRAAMGGILKGAH